MEYLIIQSAQLGNDRARTAKSCSGQALVEFTVALVAIIAIVVGTIVLARIEQMHTATMLKAREKAGALALDVMYLGALDARFISDWQVGNDNITYTPDDTVTPDGTALGTIRDIFANSGLGSISPPPEEASRLVTPPNGVSRLAASANPIMEFYLVKGNERQSIDLSCVPAFNRLITTEPVINVESEAWLTWARGLY